MHTIFGALFAILVLVPTLAPAADQTIAPSSTTPVASAVTPRKLDLNRASLPELIGVPGIGPAMAKQIVDLRQRKGAFSKLEDLLEIKGIGPKKLEGLGAYLTVVQIAVPAAAGPGTLSR